MLAWYILYHIWCKGQTLNTYIHTNLYSAKIVERIVLLPHALIVLYLLSIIAVWFRNATGDHVTWNTRCRFCKMPPTGDCLCLPSTITLYHSQPPLYPQTVCRPKLQGMSSKHPTCVTQTSVAQMSAHRINLSVHRGHHMVISIDHITHCRARPAFLHKGDFYCGTSEV